jgi:hypothetical protein
VGVGGGEEGEVGALILHGGLLGGGDAGGEKERCEDSHWSGG